MPSIRARELRRNATEAERKLWQALRRRQLGGFRFRRQVPLGPYFVDFACLSARLVVELDGSQHAEADHADADNLRTAWLNSQGYRVVRFWNPEVLRNVEGVCDAIFAALGESSTAPHPNPPPQGGRGQ